VTCLRAVILQRAIYSKMFKETKISKHFIKQLDRKWKKVV
jgi:hypothetical protein